MASVMDQPKKKHEEAKVAGLATAVQRPNLSPGHPVHRTRRIAVDLGEGVGRDETAIVVRDSDGVIDFVSGSDLCLASAAEETARFARIYHVDVSRISYDGVGVGRTFLTLSNCRFVVSEAHQRGGRHQVVEPMLMVAFAVESMNGTVVGAGLVAPRGIGAKVQQ